MKKPKNIAIVYDRITKIGGAERVLSALHEMYPDAPIYTAVYDKHSASWAGAIRIVPSFMQRIPFAKTHHEWFPWLTPLAFERFSFDAYDMVISVTSAEAKYVITKPGTVHVCYCLTPTRYLWSGVSTYVSHVGTGLPQGLVRGVYGLSLETLRTWDRIGASRPDEYIAISRFVAERIKTYYGRETDAVVYPPVDIHPYLGRKKVHAETDGNYHLLVSRLVGHKRIDVVIDAFNRLGWPLIIVGDGIERKNLERMAKENIRFTGIIPDSELISLYAGSVAFVFAGEEEFGIAAVEAMASGKPVIAYKRSGIAETVVEGKTGILFDHQTGDSLVTALKSVKKGWYDSDSCVRRAELYSKERFKKSMFESVRSVYNTYI